MIYTKTFDNIYIIETLTTIFNKQGFEQENIKTPLEVCFTEMVSIR